MLIKKKHQPIFLKFIISLPIITITFWILSTIVASHFFRNTITSEFVDSNLRIAQSISRQGVDDIKFSDYFQLRRLFRDFYNPDYMRYLMVYTPDMKPLVIYPGEISGSEYARVEQLISDHLDDNIVKEFFDSDSKKYFHFQCKILDDNGNALGYLAMGGTMDHLDVVVHKQIYSFILFGFAVLLMQVLAIIYVSHIITKPLRRVTRLMSAAEKEDPDDLIDTALDIETPKGSSRETALFLSVYQKLLRRIQEHIQNKKEMALNAAIGRMAAHVAHDIRSPLSSINKFLSHDISLDAESEQMRGSARNSLQKLVSTSEDLIDYSKARETHPLPLSVHSMISEVVSEITHLAAGKKTKIIVNCGTHLRAYLDKHKFDRVLTNVLINSIQAIPVSENGGSITIDANVKDDVLTISVTDTGSGIAPEHLPYLFDSSFTFGKVGGSGLGLSYCKNVVDAHHGRISVTSELGKGTVFTIMVPTKVSGTLPPQRSQDDIDETSELAPSEPKRTPLEDDLPTLTGEESILIIDDDPDIRKELRAIIKKYTGNYPLEMESGEELLGSSIDFSKIRLAISDFKFEDSVIDGLDALQHLKNVNVPNLYLCTSLSEDPQLIKNAAKLGVKKILGKPLVESEIAKLIS